MNIACDKKVFNTTKREIGHLPHTGVDREQPHHPKKDPQRRWHQCQLQRRGGKLPRNTSSRGALGFYRSL